MINSPLRLRLRLSPLTAPCPGMLYMTRLKGAMAAVLEFENPLNGTWHPVEVYEDAEKQKPPEGG
jgi:hypothetical protein